MRFELWGACEELVLSDLPTRCLDELELRTGKEMDSEQFTQVRATLRCNTLLLLCGGLPLGGLWMDEYNGGESSRGVLLPVEKMILAMVVASPIYSGLGPHFPPKLRREGIPQRPNLKGNM